MTTIVIPTDSSRTRLTVLPQLRHWIVLPIILGVITLLFAFTVKLIPEVAATEFRLDQLLSRHHDTVLNGIAMTINIVLSPPGIILILVLLFLFILLVRRAPVNAVAVCSVATLGWLSSEAYKIVVAEPRPNQHLLPNPLIASDGSGSFPSGHTTFAVALAIALYFLARNTRWAPLTLIGGIIFALAVGASRLYLGVHYPSDVIGSVLVAATTISLYTGLWNHFGLSVLNRVPFLDRFGPIPSGPDRLKTRRGRRDPDRRRSCPARHRAAARDSLSRPPARITKTGAARSTRNSDSGG